MIFDVIQGNPKEKPDMFDLHMRCLANATNTYDKTEEHSEFLKVVFHGVRAVVTMGDTFKDKHGLITVVNDMLSTLTPREVMGMFPVKKVYDGERWESKDYFTTMEAMKDYDLDSPIGEDRLPSFLWDYMNVTLMVFLTTAICAASEVRRIETGKGFIEEFFEEQGIATYTRFVDPVTGREYMTNNDTGERFEVKKPLPHGMKVVDGAK